MYKSLGLGLSFCHKSRVWQTDRILIARPRLHSMQCGKNDTFLVWTDDIVTIVTQCTPVAHKHARRRPYHLSNALTDALVYPTPDALIKSKDYVVNEVNGIRTRHGHGVVCIKLKYVEKPETRSPIWPILYINRTETQSWDAVELFILHLLNRRIHEALES